MAHMRVWAKAQGLTKAAAEAAEVGALQDVEHAEHAEHADLETCKNTQSVRMKLLPLKTFKSPLKYV